MYPQNISYITLDNITNVNKKLCKDLCKVGICISCFCGIYLIFFFRIIHEELNIGNVTLV